MVEAKMKLQSDKVWNITLNVAEKMFDCHHIDVVTIWLIYQED